MHSLLDAFLRMLHSENNAFGMHLECYTHSLGMGPLWLAKTMAVCIQSHMYAIRNIKYEFLYIYLHIETCAFTLNCIQH